MNITERVDQIREHFARKVFKWNLGLLCRAVLHISEAYEGAADSVLADRITSRGQKEEIEKRFKTFLYDPDTGVGSEAEQKYHNEQQRHDYCATNLARIRKEVISETKG